MNDARLTWLQVRAFFGSVQRKHLIRLLLIVGFVTCLVLVVSQFAGRNPRQLDNVFGVVETAASTGHVHGGDTHMTVTLDNGAKAIVELPKGKLFIAGARIELEVRARDAPSGTMLAYKFVRYHDAPADPDSD